jgi:dTDP-glucose pyrophosphorylase
MDFNKLTVNIDSSLIEVLSKIENLPNLQTVFVVKQDNILFGTLTDGDIRRGLLKGLDVNSPLSEFSYTEFSFLTNESDNFKKLQEFRDKRLKAVPLLNQSRQLLEVLDFTQIKSILPIDAVIMAGGLGKRLLPLTESTPKPLLHVGGKEIISYNFDRLAEFGIKNQHITVNYLGKQIEDFCNSYNESINFNIVQETKYLGTAGSISLIKKFENETILLMNSDLLTNIDYEDFYLSFLEKEADIMVASIPYEVNLPYAILESEENKVSAFTEKPSYTYFASAGIYLIKKEILNFIPSNQFFNATDLMDSVIKKGLSLIHYPIRGYWLDIGKHQDFEKAQKDIAHINWE